MAAASSRQQRSKQRRKRTGETRAAILEAALSEFAREGLAGARMEAIARAARVNIALLFYYFQSKEKLYGAVLDQVFSEWASVVLPVLRRKASPRDRVLAYIAAHFDFVAGCPLRPRLVQQEMMRQGRGGSPHLPLLVRRYIRPIHRELRRVLKAGFATGELRTSDPQHLIYSFTGAVSFYFVSAPLIAALQGSDPLDRPHIAVRRKELMNFVTASLLPAAPSRRRKRSNR